MAMVADAVSTSQPQKTLPEAVNALLEAGSAWYDSQGADFKAALTRSTMATSSNNLPLVAYRDVFDKYEATLPANTKIVFFNPWPSRRTKQSLADVLKTYRDRYLEMRRTPEIEKNLKIVNVLIALCAEWSKTGSPAALAAIANRVKADMKSGSSIPRDYKIVASRLGVKSAQPSSTSTSSLSTPWVAAGTVATALLVASALLVMRARRAAAVNSNTSDRTNQEGYSAI